MIPSSFEYLFLLLLYLLIITSLFTFRVAECLRRKSFWQSFAVFGLSWTAIELVGLELEMWKYSTEGTCGLVPLGIPIEEFIVFFLIHLATVASWETFAADSRGAR